MLRYLELNVDLLSLRTTLFQLNTSSESAAVTDTHTLILKETSSGMSASVHVQVSTVVASALPSCVSRTDVHDTPLLLVAALFHDVEVHQNNSKQAYFLCIYFWEISLSGDPCICICLC